ncbi:putative nucleotidyltransferase [Microbacterium sp. SORGH_AS 505]|uniref:nucleotidyltransferase domain-containing protein n=1 Tax=Microbacterium sp. SORGH_AS_0505 TaxID=3041770 RepID=UPI0027883065|nr:nucleotidyltransferase domain-containing protein [Microbacterium sp. SORGH_AS_0505]MDQ1126778.1 putative nucleotidyltransferase [Microbacterium sp. SORGH_AS_0505]
MRAIPADLDPDVVAEIDRRLAAVSRDHDVEIPWAIESGSRAWGFPSPDSDYDCRFIFVRPREQYLTLWPERDVIETPLDAVFDVNGWDLAKSVKLIAKGNATAIEWLRSPIVYTGDPAFRDGLLDLADRIVERGAVGRHYLHVARQQRAGKPTLKRFFYVLRPAAALRWLEVHPAQAVPPMDLPTLIEEGDLDDDVRTAVHDLIAQKAQTRELGAGTPPATLDRFVTAQLDRAEVYEDAAPERDGALVRSLADEYFLSLVRPT